MGRLLDEGWLADTELFSDGLEGGGPGAAQQPPSCHSVIGSRRPGWTNGGQKDPPATSAQSGRSPVWLAPDRAPAESGRVQGPADTPGGEAHPGPMTSR